MEYKVTPAELLDRRSRFCRMMEDVNPGWNTAIILSKVNQYYFTGTMQDALLLIKRGGKAFYFVRRSFERAKEESPLEGIYPIKSYRDAAAVAGEDCGSTFFETEVATLAILARLQKAFHFDRISSLDRVISSLRAVKSPYELYFAEQSGKLHHEFLTEIVPGLLREGMTEADFAACVYEGMVRHGHHGVSRFSMFQTEMIAGQIGFGENSLIPTSFDGPGGAAGIGPAAPVLGSRERRLKKGDLVFVDIGFGLNGYHSDKTQVYCFGGRPSDEATQAHRGCIEVQKMTAAELRPGAIPSKIYEKIMGGLSEEFLHNFMGFGSRRANFLGHGVGLQIDELPVIAKGFDEPLCEGMLIALEPKKGIEGQGMVGVEETYLVTPEGGRCITGGGRDIMVV